MAAASAPPARRQVAPQRLSLGSFGPSFPSGTSVLPQLLPVPVPRVCSGKPMSSLTCSCGTGGLSRMCGCSSCSPKRVTQFLITPCPACLPPFLRRRNGEGAQERREGGSRGAEEGRRGTGPAVFPSQSLHVWRPTWKQWCGLGTGDAHEASHRAGVRSSRLGPPGLASGSQETHRCAPAAAGQLCPRAPPTTTHGFAASRGLAWLPPPVPSVCPWLSCDSRARLTPSQALPHLSRPFPPWWGCP